MKRAVVAVALAVTALALLFSLVLRSSSVPIEKHLTHHAAIGELERASDDYKTFIATLVASFDSSQAPGEGARALLARISSGPQRLQDLLWLDVDNTSQQNRVRNSFEGYSSTVAKATALAEQLITQQTEYAASVGFIRESGPRLVQQMRDIRLDRVAADTFQLIAGTLEFARPTSTAQETDLRRLFVTLGRDQRIDANMPAEITKLRKAIETILQSKATIRSELSQLADAPVPSNASALSVAQDTLYRSTLASVDQARTILAMYALLLLVAASFVAYRLHHSYRDLNRANEQLAGLNQSLEQRVEARTEELEKALKVLKESQVQLVQAEKMSSLGQLVAGISHEINTPLLYLANNAELIGERLELIGNFIRHCVEAFGIRAGTFSDRAEFQAKFIDALRTLKISLRDEEIEASLEEARDLVRDSVAGLGDLTEMAQSLKDFSRLDRAPIAKFDVNAGLEKTLLIAKNIIKHKADVSKFYGELPEIACSPSKINQVFLNIITNAAQAIEQHGEIAITTKQRDAEHIEIRIADTGCGIPEDNLAKIRDPFFTTKEVGTGTGLGLSIVDEIIRSHHGELLVESEVGKGSVFTIVLPVRQPNPATQQADADASSGAGEYDAQDEPREQYAEAS
jgi:two-component system, NtrC family, sensor kinase